MSEIKGDFIGFTFNGVHSSELGLMRVSDGSRYNENLFPTIEDKTIPVPGADGTYFFGSYYTQQPFNISVAFDDMSEEQFQKLKRLLGDKRIHDFIFDESPYKVYRVKSTGTPNLKYVCFEKEVNSFDREYQKQKEIKDKNQLYEIGSRSPRKRVYKGEGQLNFISYNTKARSRYKYLDEYTVQNIPEWGSMNTSSASNVNHNLYDWIDGIKLKRSDASKKHPNNNNIYTIDQVTTSGVMVYNPGNYPTYFNLYFFPPNNISNWSFSSGCMLSSQADINFDGFLKIGSINLKNNDEGFRINGALNLIEGVIRQDKYVKVQFPSFKNPAEEQWYTYNGTNYIQTQNTSAQQGVTYYEKKIKYIPTGTIYNESIEAGNFFQIPITEDLIWLYFSPAIGSTMTNFEGIIEYDYLYY